MICTFESVHDQNVQGSDTRSPSYWAKIAVADTNFLERQAQSGKPLFICKHESENMVRYVLTKERSYVMWFRQVVNYPCCKKRFVFEKWTKWRMNIYLINLPVVIVETSWSGLALCLVNGSARQYSLAMWPKSSRWPGLLSCLNIWIKWWVSFCSGKCVVWAVVTKLLASVLRWLGRISPLTSAPKST